MSHLAVHSIPRPSSSTAPLTATGTTEARPPAGAAGRLPRLVVLSAGFGEGHNAAARALVEAADTLHGPGTARLVDAFAAASPSLNRFSRRLYLTLINRAPRLWSAAYAWLDRSPSSTRGIGLLRGETRVLRRLLTENPPEAICSTYPVYGYILQRLAAEGLVVPPFYNIVTDSISINSLWWRAPCEGWFLPNLDSTTVLRAAGVPADRLYTTGFPVAAFFADHARQYYPPSLADGARPRVLYIINSGTRHAVETARSLLNELDWDITFAVGRDVRLQHELVKLAAGRARPPQILGWTHRIPELLMTHHVVVSKAGGATTQEAIAARCPMIVNQIVPGQEEGNYELLRRHDVGGLAQTPGDLIATLRRAFARRGARWKRWRESLEKLARPQAALAILAHVLPTGSLNSASSSQALSSPTIRDKQFGSADRQ